jgi:rhodanese-related sulfurtransferase
MSVNRVTPDEAAKLLGQGWVYLDVRSVPEFATGHPPGAYNIPLLHATEAGRTPNPAFVDEVVRAFPKQTRLVVGCRTGRRSLDAAEVLLATGYEAIVDMRGGMVGETGPAGELVCQGWQGRDHAVATSPEPGHDYDSLKR